MITKFHGAYKVDKILSINRSVSESETVHNNGGGGGGGDLLHFFLISCFYHSENMYWVTLNVKINFKEFLTPHNPPVHTP